MKNSSCNDCANGVVVLRRLGVEEDKIKIILPGWGADFIGMPEKIPFLQKKSLEELKAFFPIGNKVMDALYEAASVVNKNSDLAAYVWHFYCRVKSGSPADFSAWFLPEPRSVVALIVCGLLRDAMDRYRQENYPEDVIRDTLKTYIDIFERQVEKGDLPFLKLRSIYWIRNYLACQMVQIGRFNFRLMEVFPFGIVLKHKTSGKKVMLSASGIIHNSKGFVLQENDPYRDGQWQSSLEETEDFWCGNPVSPKGFALQKRETFLKKEYRCILAPGDIMIDMHIPAGGGMTPEKSLDSFQRAVEFFSSRFPGKFKKVFLCHSWIFNTQFEEKLPDSNLAKLMRECYLFPRPSSGRDGMIFLFGQDYEDISQAPGDTSQRRAMLEILESGEHLRTGGMILFAEDLSRFGTQCYRKDFEELCAEEVQGSQDVTTTPVEETATTTWRRFWQPRFKQKLEEAERLGEKIDIVLCGDSITHKWEEYGKYQETFAGHTVLNLGFCGDRVCHTLWVINNQKLWKHLDPKLVVLLIGTNNTPGYNPKEIAEGIRLCLEGLKRQAPNAKIVLFAIFPRDKDKTSPLRNKIAQINAAIKNYADGETVVFENISSHFVDRNGSIDELLMPDHLHLSDAGYHIWTAALKKYL